MSKIVLDAESLGKLSGLTTDTLIVDESGKWVGLFVPADRMYPPISDEERERRRNLPGKDVTTAELLQMLERS